MQDELQIKAAIGRLDARVDTLERYTHHLTDKLNRAELNAAHDKPVVHGDTLAVAVDQAVAILSKAVNRFESVDRSRNEAVRRTVLNQFIKLFSSGR